MTVNCQAMADTVNGQSSERNQALGSDASTMTIEFLRARLLSERAASKTARQEAQQIAEKVAELQARLDLEVKNRRKAELALEEVRAALKAKGLIAENDAFPLAEEKEAGSVSSDGNNDKLDSALCKGSSVNNVREMTVDPVMEINNVKEGPTEHPGNITQIKQGVATYSEEHAELKEAATENPVSDGTHTTELLVTLESSEVGNNPSELRPLPSACEEQRTVESPSVEQERGSSNMGNKVGSCNADGHQIIPTASSPDLTNNNLVEGQREVLPADLQSSEQTRGLLPNEAAQNRLATAERLKEMLRQLNQEVAALPKEQPLKQKLQSWMDHVGTVLEDKEQSLDSGSGLLDAEKLLGSVQSLRAGHGQDDSSRDALKRVPPLQNHENLKHAEGLVELASKVNAEMIMLTKAGLPPSQMQGTESQFDISAMGRPELLGALNGAGQPCDSMGTNGRRHTPVNSPPYGYYAFNDPMIQRRQSPESLKGDNRHFYAINDQSQMPSNLEMQYNAYQSRLMSYGMVQGAYARVNYGGAEWPYFPSVQSPGRGQMFYHNNDSHIVESQSPRKSDDSVTEGDNGKDRQLKGLMSEDILGYERGQPLYAATGYGQSRVQLPYSYLGQEMAFKPQPRRSQRVTPLRDATLDLVDDKSGRLGGILMALNFAKQQVKEAEDEVSFSQTVGRFDAESHNVETREMARDYYRAWRHGPVQTQAPIVHLPTSPTSDQGLSAFERNDELRRSHSVSVDFMTRGYEAQVQPRGEVHLGNGITLYTD